MGIKDWPIVNGTPAQEEAHLAAIRKGVQAEGAAARKVGVPISKCPPFVDSDMAVDWKIGWRYEDEYISGKRDRKTNLLRD